MIHNLYLYISTESVTEREVLICEILLTERLLQFCFFFMSLCLYVLHNPFVTTTSELSDFSTSGPTIPFDGPQIFTTTN